MRTNGMSGLFLAAIGALSLAGCAGNDSGKPKETADQFIARVDGEMRALARDINETGWIQATYITPDSQAVSARAMERFLAYYSATVKEARAYDGQPMSPATARAIQKLKLGLSMPAPDDPAKRAELTKISTKLEATYGEAKFCPDGPESCEGVDALGEVLATSRDYDRLPNAELADRLRHNLDRVVIQTRVLVVRLRTVDRPGFDLHLGGNHDCP